MGNYNIHFEAFCSIEADCEEDARAIFEDYIWNAPFYFEVDDGDVIITDEEL